MIAGSVYLERGELVEVTCQWNGTANPDLDRLRALLPLVATRPSRPRNVLIRCADGSTVVRPFRGLKRPSAAPATQARQSVNPGQTELDLDTEPQETK